MTDVGIDLVFKVPSFVKEASAVMLDTNQEGALVVYGYRLDNPAAAWTTAAMLKKQAMADPGFSPSHRLLSMVDQACDLFGINDSMFELNPVEADSVIVKEANEEAEFTISDCNDYNEVVNELLNKRASASYKFCNKCAKELMKFASEKDYTVYEPEVEEKLRKLAGDYPVDFNRGADEVAKRKNYAKALGMEKEASIFGRLEEICRNNPPVDVVPHIIEGIDDFDRECKVLTKTATKDFLFPEDAFYMNTEESIKKYASEQMIVGKGYTIERKVLMNEDAKNNIRKWASDCGYSLPDDPSPEEIVGMVNQMPESLQKEFIGGF